MARDEDAGVSLWADAWRRLRKNRMAMAGLVVVAIMTFAAVFADVISPMDPETQERWDVEAPPLTEHLDLRNEMNFTLGSVPRDMEVSARVHERLGDGEEHVLELEVLKERVDRLRLTLGGGRLNGVQVFSGDRMIGDTLTLRDDQFLRVEGGARLKTRTLTKGGDVPPEIDATVAVVFVERVTRSAEAKFDVRVTFDGKGAVTNIEAPDSAFASAARNGLRVKGGSVLDAKIDGERPTHFHVLGTDSVGRDSLSRLIHGARISLLVGLTATLVSLILGVLYGAVSGYAGGRVDALMMRFVDVAYAVPFMFLVILLLVAFGRSLVILFIALGAVQWLTMARIVRGQVLSLREKEFIDAAITTGTRTWGILTRHLIPNTLGVVIVYTTLTIPAVILQESFLAFLGLTVEYDGRPLESWGALVNQGAQTLTQDARVWWLLVFPAFAMSITLFSLNFLGDGLRDALDPQQRGRG